MFSTWTYPQCKACMWEIKPKTRSTRSWTFSILPLLLNPCITSRRTTSLTGSILTPLFFFYPPPPPPQFTPSLAVICVWPNFMYPVNLKPGEFLYWEIAPQQTVSSRKLLFSDSIARLMSILREDVDPSHNFVFQLLSKGKHWPVLPSPLFPPPCLPPLAPSFF